MDICIFCAARLRLTSTRSIATRRFLQHASSRRRPAFTEALQEQNIEGTVGNGDAQQFRIRRTAKKPSKETSPQYEKPAQVESLGQLGSILQSVRSYSEAHTRPDDARRISRRQDAAANPSVQDTGDFFEIEQQKLNTGNGAYRPDWLCMKCRYRNRTRRPHCAKCETPRPEPREWTCQVCKSNQSAEMHRCHDCGGDPGFVETTSWKNLPKKANHAQLPPNEQATMIEKMKEEARVAREERMKRSQAAQVGGFVGIRRTFIKDKPDDQFSPERAQMYTPREDKYSPRQGRDVSPRHQNEYREGLEGLRDYGYGDDQALPQASQTREGRVIPKYSADLDFLGNSATEQNLGPSDSVLSPNQDSLPYRYGPSGRSLSFPSSEIRDAQPQRYDEDNLWARKKRRRSDFNADPTEKSHVQLGKRQNDRRRGLMRMEKNMRDEEDEGDFDDEARSERLQKKKQAKQARKTAAGPTKIHLPGFISVGNLAGLLRIRVEDFLAKMQDAGFDDLAHDHILDGETAGLIAAEFNFEAVVDAEEGEDLIAQPTIEDKSELPPRPPVVTIMGHVDHGKTTMLDFLRKSSVAASEHGGITQHIGAFSVEMSGGRFITFLDTPGHEAFLTMRQRGANVTDIVILVVAADDSVMPQTLEAIKHAQNAKVPVIVAVNKVDKPEANVDRVKQDLSRHGIDIEDYGGDTQVVCVSGKTGQGMADLEDAVTAQADILDMRATDTGPVEGWVLESTTRKAGRVATVLVRRGTLRLGDVIVAGTSWARVRSLRNEAGAALESAGPGYPAEIDGWRSEPSAGDELLQASSEQHAKNVVSARLEALSRSQNALDIAAVNEARRIEQEKREAEKAAADASTKTSNNSENAAEESSSSTTTTSADPSGVTSETDPSKQPQNQTLHIILKADVSGSLDALRDSILALSVPEIQPLILRSAVGPVSSFDIDHASVARGHIISFNLPSVPTVLQREADLRGVKIVDESIIYRISDRVRALMSERLPVVVKRSVQGEAEVGAIFDINVRGRVRVPVAGCRVRNGVVERGRRVVVRREGVGVVFDGECCSDFSLLYLARVFCVPLARWRG